MSGVSTAFSRNLKRLRAERGLTQAQLEEAAGLAAGSVARYETEDRRPRRDAIGRIAAALNVSPADLDRDETPARTIEREDEYSHRPAAIALLATIPKYEPVLAALRVYRAKEEDPSIHGWRVIADELLAERNDAAGDGLGDEERPMTPEALAGIAKKGRRKR